MLYLIGLGLNSKGISLEALEACKKCKQVYLDNYTIEYPYSVKELEKVIGKKIVRADREFIEQGIDKILEDLKKQNVALLVYGSPLFATTHISVLETCKNKKIKYKIIYSASVLDAVAETGLQIYKFGKITNIPKWDEEKNFKPDSFVNVIKENQSIGAHSLILIDIGLNFKDALEELTEASKGKIKLDKIIICSRLGRDDSRVYYVGINSSKISKLNKLNIKAPFCVVVPGKLHFIEKEVLKRFE